MNNTCQVIDVNEHARQKSCISDIAYGDVLREILLEKSRKNGGKGDLKVSVLSSSIEKKKVIRILFCDAGGGVIFEKDSKDYTTMTKWFSKQPNKINGKIVIFGDLCALVCEGTLTEKKAQKDAGILFAALKNTLGGSPFVSNIIG